MIHGGVRYSAPARTDSSIGTDSPARGSTHTHGSLMVTDGHKPGSLGFCEQSAKWWCWQPGASDSGSK